MNEVRALLTGRGLLESPRWHGERLYISDWSAGEVVAVDIAGHGEVIARVASLPLCAAWLPDGDLVIVSSSEGRLLRCEPDGSLVSYADLGRPGWNDIVVDGRGNAYVNRAGFDPMSGEEFQPGFVHLVTPDGSVREVADDVAFPNGMAVSADNSTLIVADSYRHSLVAFDIGADGGLSGRRTWADLGEGTPDGICLDAQGAVWYADVPNKRCVRVAEGGTVLRTVGLDRGGFACALGGPELTTLFIVGAQWRGMSESQLVAPGSGAVFYTQVDVPGPAGRDPCLDPRPVIVTRVDALYRDALPLTGERTVPGIPAENYWFRRHEIAYAFAQPLVAGLTVLEVGCGEGYGTAMLARTASSVLGIDYDAITIAHAASRYPRARFARGNLAALPVRSASVDLVATLQVIEHVWNHPEFVRECLRVLRPGGLLLVTTPNRLTFSPGLDTPVNPFHTKEFTATELVDLLARCGFVGAEVRGLHAGARLRGLDAEHGGSFVDAQLAAPPDGWSAQLAADVASVVADDFAVLAAEVHEVDESLDLVVLARRPD